MADAGSDSRIFSAATVTEHELRQYMAEQIEKTISTGWDAGTKSVRSLKTEKLGALVLKEELVTPEDGELVLTALLQGIRLEGPAILPWTHGSRQLAARLQFMHRLEPEWPDVAEGQLMFELETWLAPYLHGIRNAQQLSRLKLGDILEARLTLGAETTSQRMGPRPSWRFPVAVALRLIIPTRRRRYWRLNYKKCSERQRPLSLAAVVYQ